MFNSLSRLGLKHDDFQQYSRFIMAPFVDSLFHNHRWSPQSQFMMTKNIRYIHVERDKGNLNEKKLYIYAR